MDNKKIKILSIATIVALLILLTFTLWLYSSWNKEKTNDSVKIYEDWRGNIELAQTSLDQGGVPSFQIYGHIARARGFANSGLYYSNEEVFDRLTSLSSELELEISRLMTENPDLLNEDQEFLNNQLELVLQNLSSSLEEISFSQIEQIRQDLSKNYIEYAKLPSEEVKSD